VILSNLVEEVKIWNTPIVGAYLLWRFTQGYCDGHVVGDAPIGLLHFVASAILTNERLILPVSGQRKNLQSYVRSFENKKDSDILLNLQYRIKEKSSYTLSAIDIAISEGLLVWEVESGKLYPRKLTRKAGRGKALKPKIKLDGNRAELLGKWFSEHDLSTIGAYLRVVF
jgi:hypothetical protein